MYISYICTYIYIYLYIFTPAACVSKSGLWTSRPPPALAVRPPPLEDVRFVLAERRIRLCQARNGEAPCLDKVAAVVVVVVVIVIVVEVGALDLPPPPGPRGPTYPPINLPAYLLPKQPTYLLTYLLTFLPTFLTLPPGPRT